MSFYERFKKRADEDSPFRMTVEHIPNRYCPECGEQLARMKFDWGIAVCCPRCTAEEDEQEDRDE